MGSSIKDSTSYRVFQIINIVFMVFVIFVTLYPFIYVTSMSFSSEVAAVNGKVRFLPVEPNVEAYKLVVNHPGFITGYKNTVLYTVGATLVGLFMTIICAYPLSKKVLPGKQLIMKLMVFTMFFHGGLIPTYLLVRNLGWINDIRAIIVPGAISVWNMIIMRTFFMGIPDTLEEAAEIDGLNPIQTLIQIVLPLSKPIIATIGLFIAVFQWNNWFTALIYMNSNEKYPVTLFLRNILMGARLSDQSAGDITSAEMLIKPSETLKSAAIIMVAVPILMIYPFIQKYFVKGMMIGSLKG